MPRYIGYYEGQFFEWSTIVESPVTTGGTRDEFVEYYRDEYGRSKMGDLPERMERAEKNGTSSRMGETLNDLVEVAMLNGTIKSWDHFRAMLAGTEDTPA